MIRLWRALIFPALVAVMLSGLFATGTPAAAQYGGISGLFVTTSPDTPGFADFSGLGCAGGVEVVLYFPGLPPTASDPVANQSVPGRIIAVGTSISSPDALLNGTFAFPDVRLPSDVEPGVYEVHSRCGGLDLRVRIQIDSDGAISLQTDPDVPVINPTENPGIPQALPFTGRESNRVASLAIGIVAMGVALLALSRRQSRALN